MDKLSAIIYILLGGFAGALQARVLGNVETKVGILGNMLLNFFFGLVLTLIIISTYSLIQYQHPLRFYNNLFLDKVKLWEMTAGVFGIIIVTSIGVATSRIGITSTLLLFLFSQIFLGMILDHFGWLGDQNFPITPTKILAILIIGLGTFLFLRS